MEDYLIPSCYRPKCETCPFKDSCKDYDNQPAPIRINYTYPPEKQEYIGEPMPGKCPF